MAGIITNNRQVPDHAILDFYNKQTYLANSFIYSTGAVTVTGTSETNLVLLQNPIANSNNSGVNGLPLGLFLKSIRVQAQTATHTAQFNVYLNPTFSAAGTSQTPLNLRFASSATSQMTATTGPTTSVLGTLIMSMSSSAFASETNQVLSIIDPGQTILITVVVSNASDKVNAQLTWYEL